MLAHAFMARFKQHDAGGMPDRRETELIERCVHQASVLEAIAAAAARDDLVLEAFGIEPNGTAEQNVEAFERDAGDVGAEDTGQGVVSRRAWPLVVDTIEIGVEVEWLGHRERLPALLDCLRKQHRRGRGAHAS